MTNPDKTTIWLTEIKSALGHGYRLAEGPDDYADEPGDQFEIAAEWRLPEGWKVVETNGGEMIETAGGEIVWPNIDAIPHSSGRPQLVTSREGMPILHRA